MHVSQFETLGAVRERCASAFLVAPEVVEHRKLSKCGHKGVTFRLLKSTQETFNITIGGWLQP